MCFNTSLKKIYKQKTNTWKAQYHMSLGNCKLKQQRDTTAHLLEGPTSKTRTTPNARENVEEQEFSFIAGGSAKWYSHSGRQFLTKLNILLPYNPAITHLCIYPKALKTELHAKHAHTCL